MIQERPHSPLDEMVIRWRGGNIPSGLLQHTESARFRSANSLRGFGTRLCRRCHRRHSTDRGGMVCAGPCAGCQKRTGSNVPLSKKRPARGSAATGGIPRTRGASRFYAAPCMMSYRPPRCWVQHPAECVQCGQRRLSRPIDTISCLTHSVNEPGSTRTP